SDGMFLPIKPMQSFLSRLTSRLNELARTVVGRPLRFGIVGGGAGGVEIAFCLPKRISMALPERGYTLHLIHGAKRLLPGLLDSTATLVEQRLRRNATQLHLGRRVVEIRNDSVLLDDESELELDVLLWATSASPPPLLGKLGLATDDRGFLSTRSTLQSKTNDRIFAVGDTGTIENVDRPKSGVFAVRQGPILWKNLRAMIEGGPLEDFRPQKEFLKLLNTADGQAVAEYQGRSFANSWAWKWKDVIDTRFMDKYQDYTPMKMKPKPASAETEMRCLGCGGKVGGTVLSRVLEQLEIPQREEVLVGLDAPDDAAVIRFDSQQTVTATTDFFAAPLDDPFIVGRIAALNALSDSWAMGSHPMAALTIASIPVGRESSQERLLSEMLAGSLLEFRKANTALVGGHTIEGPRISLGYTVLAKQPDSETWSKSGLSPGDALILTKPLGSGVLLAGLMQAQCEGPWYDNLLQSMLTSNQRAAEVAAELGIAAATDVTGFGLAGHLFEMLKASGVDAKIDFSELPILTGALDLAQNGIASSLLPANRHCEADMDVSGGMAASAKFGLLFDPQTCGGMLLAVHEAAADECLQRLWDDYPQAAVIGSVTSKSDSPRISVV
ncbi:MAG: selenide, water dikinase SelD, partial [Planctomycetota bacterium]